MCLYPSRLESEKRDRDMYNRLRKKFELVQESDSTNNLQELRSLISKLKSYLMSEKFHKDTTVQVQDVLNRLEL